MDSEIVKLCEKINKSIERLASLHVASPAWWEENYE